MSWNTTWEKIFATSDWGKYPPEELIRFIASHFYKAPNRSDVKILEIGCGPGANLWYLSREGFSATGIDGSPSAILKAEARLNAENLNATLIVGDLIDLPHLLLNQTYDAVIDVECLYANRIQFVREIIRNSYHLLKPGGVMFSKMFARETIGDGLGTEVEPGTFIDVTDGPLADTGLCHFFTQEEIESCFSDFEEIHLEISMRSLDSRQSWIKEWVVQARKAG